MIRHGRDTPLRRRTGTAISFAAAFLGLASAQEESSHADFHAIEQSIEAGDFEGASRAIADWKKSPSPSPETLAKILNLEGTLEFTRVNTEASLAAFSEALKLEISAPLRTDLLYNAALVAGLSDQTEAYLSYSTQLSEAAGPNSSLPGDLALERGLTEASRSSALAFETLETFLHRFPDHPRVADAEISLAELYLI
ncbi:MAG: hypothetical protein KDL87_09475, partial [Verrucomicrobiae bacterium]|nr:hypothetical protein [Verrucomicrobiae bacterium]